MKAVRFSFPSFTEEGEYEQIAGSSNGVDDDDAQGYVETESRTGSQLHLTRRETTSKQKTTNSFLCGLCCSKAPAVSAWNCDGEILPITDIICR